MGQRATDLRVKIWMSRANREKLHHPYDVHPRANPSAAQISSNRPALSMATRRPNRALETVTRLCKFTAHERFIPSASVKSTSDGTPRMVLVMGATVTADKYPMALRS